MSEAAIFLNSGPLLNADRLEEMESLDEWEQVDEAARAAYERIEEVYEKHATLLAGEPSREQTRFFMINPTFHALGYTYSVYEPIALDEKNKARVDYALFEHAGRFEEGRDFRGNVPFFAPAITIAQTLAWHEDLAGEEAPELETTSPTEEAAAEAEANDEEPPTPDEEDALAPAASLDLLLQATGTNYGLLTNGWNWRLYHRSTSSLHHTFFEADLISAMKTDFEEFKRFFLLFRREAFVLSDVGTNFVDRLLQ